MKKFSKVTNQKIGEDPKIEIKINEEDIFKAKVFRLMDDFLKVQMYGPITRYHVAGTMKVTGKELFLEALMDLLSDVSNKGKISLLESLKFKIKDWETIDQVINEINSEPINLHTHRLKIKSLYNKYKSDYSLLVKEAEKSANRIKNPNTLLLRYKACEQLLHDTSYNSEIMKKISEQYLNKYKSI